MTENDRLKAWMRAVMRQEREKGIKSGLLYAAAAARRVGHITLAELLERVTVKRVIAWEGRCLNEERA